MIDIKSHKVIDMIETREREPVTEWLKSYPNLRVVSRDGSITYKSAIESAHPKAAQVSDRFHLLKNLTEYSTEYLKKELPAQIAITSTEQSAEAIETTENVDCQTELSKEKENRKLTLAEKYEKIEEMRQAGNTKTQICKNINMDVRTYDKLISMTSSDREKMFSTNLSLTHEEKIELKMERVAEVRGMKQASLSKREIMRRTGLHKKTIDKYLDENFSPVHAMYGVTKAGILTPYKKEIDSMLESGARGTEIIQKIRSMGYRGSDANARYYMSDWKKYRKQLYDKTSENGIKTEKLERKNVFKLLFHSLDKVKCISSPDFDTLYAEYPCFAKIHSLVWDFRNLLKSKDGLNLFGWLKKAKELCIREINSFAEGVERDFMAVYNAINLDYNNGLAEGKVNKLKLVKRVMFGKGSFSTLKNKVLLLENLFPFN